MGLYSVTVCYSARQDNTISIVQYSTKQYNNISHKPTYNTLGNPQCAKLANLSTQNWQLSILRISQYAKNCGDTHWLCAVVYILLWYLKCDLHSRISGAGCRMLGELWIGNYLEEGMVAWLSFCPWFCVEVLSKTTKILTQDIRFLGWYWYPSSHRDESRA